MPDEFEELDGWVSMTDAAERLGFTRQNLHKKIKNGSIPAEHVRQIGESDRKIYVIAASYVDMLVRDYHGTEKKKEQETV